MSEWETYKLNELGTIITGKTPSSKFPEDFGDSYPFITPTDYKNFVKYIKKTDRKLSNEGAYKLKTKILPKNSVMVTCIGSDMGKVGMNPIEAVTNQQINSIIPDSRIVDSFFLYYLLNAEYDTLRMYGQEGTAVPIVNKSTFEKIELKLPPLPEQQAIAEVLSCLDDKIDLLHRNNKTLEEMAETLFRQWFVEGAKEGWEEIKVKDLSVYISDFVANGSFQSLKENVTLYPDKKNYALFIRNTDLKSNFTNKVYVDEHSYHFLSKSKLSGGEVIISNVADVGSVHLCPSLDIPMTLGNNTILLNSEYNYFLYYYFKSNLGQTQINGITSGSAQQKFNKTDFRNLEISILNEQHLIDFHNQVSILQEKIQANKRHIEKIALTRDTLLPKLMSGQVRVKTH